MISYMEFLEVVKEQLPVLLPEEYKDAAIEVIRADKYLSTSYDGISVAPKDDGAGVCMDLEYLYLNLDRIEEVPAAVSMAAQDVLRALEMRPKGLELLSEDRDFFQEHVIPQLIPIRGNEEVLEQLPHKILDDMAIVYRTMFPLPDGDMLSAVVDHGFLDHFHMSEMELYETVMEHAPVAFPMTVEEVGGSSHLLFEAYFNNMRNGSACILYPDFIARAAEVIGSNFFVLPFSVHVALLVKDNGDISTGFLRETAFRLAADPMFAGDRLTKEVYYCDIEDMTMRKAGGYCQ